MMIIMCRECLSINSLPHSIEIYFYIQKFKYLSLTSILMGRIKSLMIKNTARELLSKEASLFSTSFEHNKKMLGSTMPSKPIRNKIAGYITRLERARSKPVQLRTTQPALTA